MDTNERGIEKVVPQASSGRRLDVFLTEKERSSGVSRRDIRLATEGGHVSVNGMIETDPSRRLRYGDLVTLRAVLKNTARLAATEGMMIPVLFEDDDLLIIMKPAGIQMHPAGKDMEGTVANWIASTRPEMLSVGDDPSRPGIVHRLDRNTSGVVVLAKNKESFRMLQNLFRSRRIRKTYLALVTGNVAEKTGVIKYPLGNRTGTLRRLAIMDGSCPRGARSAITEYRLKTRYTKYDLLEVSPKTGRTHQIRAHFAAIGHPVLGDRLYGGRRMKRAGMPERQLLHAASIAFLFDGENRSFEAPLPSDFIEFLSGIDETVKEGYLGEASDGSHEV